jgi:hypothetical protein
VIAKFPTAQIATTQLEAEIILGALALAKKSGIKELVHN